MDAEGKQFLIHGKKHIAFATFNKVQRGCWAGIEDQDQGLPLSRAVASEGPD